MTDVITTRSSYVVGVIIKEGRGVSSHTRMISDQGNCMNPGIVISEELFQMLGLGYANRVRLRL